MISMSEIIHIHANSRGVPTGDPRRYPGMELWGYFEWRRSLSRDFYWESLAAILYWTLADSPSYLNQGAYEGHWIHSLTFEILRSHNKTLSWTFLSKHFEWTLKQYTMLNCYSSLSFHWAQIKSIVYWLKHLKAKN